jgi:hypothetical protein
VVHLKKLIVILLIFTFTLNANAYKDPERKSVFLEVGGNAYYGSLNFESMFGAKRHHAFAFRIGLGGYPVVNTSDFVIALPVAFNYLVGRKSHFLDLSLGQSFTVDNNAKFEPITTGGIGYRYQKSKSPIFFRAAYTPLVNYLYGFDVKHWAGLTIGFTFNLAKCNTCPTFD